MRIAAVLLSVSAGAGACSSMPRVDYRLPGVAVSPFGTSVQNVSQTFGRTFCEVLRHLGPEHGTWGSCALYLESAPADAMPAAGDIPADLGVLVVGGIFSHCFEAHGIRAFEQGLAHLKNDHHLEAGPIPVGGLATPAENAKTIDAYLQKHPEKKFIAIGHSKGSVDLMTAIVKYKSAQDGIVALVSVAGAVAGSRLMDFPMPIAKAGFQIAATLSGLGRCPMDETDGMLSLRRHVRYAFLTTEWKAPPGLRSFSLVGVVPKLETSRPLHLMWDRLQYYSLDQDSQVVAEEAIIPGAQFLGVAKGDHWAVALPFTKHKDPKFGERVDKNRFPRTALLEAIVRHVHASR